MQDNFAGKKLQKAWAIWGVDEVSVKAGYGRKLFWFLW